MSEQPLTEQKLRDAINLTAIPTLLVFAEDNPGVREAIRVLSEAVAGPDMTRDQRWEYHVQREIERIRKAAVG